MSSHHRHRSRRGLAYAIVFTLLLAAALFPEACVGFAETRLLAAAAWLVAAAGLLYPAHHRRKPFATPRALLACLALLALWSLFQLVPLPAFLHPLLWRGTAFPDRAAILSDVVSRAGGALSLAVEPHRTFHTLLLWGGLAALSLAAAKRLRTSVSRNAVLHGIVVLALAEAAYALFSREPGMPRLRGSFANADALGGLLAIALPLAAGGLFAALGKTGGRLRGVSPRHAAKAALFLLAGVLLLLALFFTGSRGAALAALLSLAGMLSLQWTENALLRRPIAFFLPAVIALFAVFTVNAQRLHVLERTTGEDALAQATEARTSIWRAAAALARDFPFGTGADGTPTVLGIYQTPRFGRYRLDYAHNDFLQFLGDWGVPGMALLLLATGFLLARAVRVSRAGSDSRSPWMMRGACAALAAAIVHSLVEFNLSARPALQLVFALLAGVVLSAPLLPKRPAAAAVAADVTPPRSRFRTFLRFAWKSAIAAAAVLAVVSSLAAARSYRTARAAALAAGLPSAPTDSAWLKPAPLPLADAPEALARAAELDPFSPFVPAVAADAALALHRAAVTNAALAADAARRAESGEEDEESAPAEPTRESLLASELVLRFDEAALVRDVRPHAETAARLSPWSADAAALAAWFVLRGKALHVATGEDARAARESLDRLARLWKDDARAQFEIASAYAAEDDPANHAAVSAAAARAIALDPSLAAEGVEIWRESGMAFGEIVSLLPEDCPFEVLRKLHRRAAALDATDEERLALLSRIRGKLPPLPDEEALVLPDRGPGKAKEAAEARAAAAAWQWAANESLVRDLARGDWAAVAESAATREAVRTARYLSLVQPLRRSPMAFRLRLRALAKDQTLPRYGRVEQALAECGQGLAGADAFAAVWREAAGWEMPAQLASSVVGAPKDAIARAAPERHAAEPEEGALALSFLGERLFLDAVQAERTDERAPRYRVVCRWRAAAPPLPATLEARVRLRDGAGRTVAQRKAVFDEAWEGYRRGEPEPGAVFETEILFPHAAAQAETAEIVLSAAKRAFRCDDLAKRLALPFPALPGLSPEGN